MASEENMPTTVDLSDSTIPIPSISSFRPVPVVADEPGTVDFASHSEQGAFSPLNCIYIPYDDIF